jgi:hypothetical protein
MMAVLDEIKNYIEGLKDDGDIYYIDNKAEDLLFEGLKELEAASAYIQEHEVIHKKLKKDIPTVIEYKGRRYVLDHDNQYRG